MKSAIGNGFLILLGIEAADTNEDAEWLAKKTGGIAQSVVLEAAANIPTTAHLLGGAVIGRDASTGVIDRNHQVFGYRNLLVCDGSALPANPGVNPSLTITAMTERAMAAIPRANAQVRPAPPTQRSTRNHPVTP